MAKQEEVKRPRYTVRCLKCAPINKWNAEAFNVCDKCGSVVLEADDHHRGTSRRYVNGVEVARDYL